MNQTRTNGQSNPPEQLRRKLLAVEVLLLAGLMFNCSLVYCADLITVDLFAARPALKSVILEAPFTIDSRGTSPGMRGLFEITNVHGILHLRESKRASPQFKIQASESGMAIGRRAVIKAGAQKIAVHLTDGTSRQYRGTLLITPQKGETLSIKNVVKLPDYVISVVGSESLPKTPQEALKAQCVLVQTLLLRYKPGDKLLDSTQTQAYLGVEYERPEARRAFNATRGARLLCNGTPVPVYFHSTCAGGTSSSQVFSNKKPTMMCDASVKCDFCKESPFWSEKITVIPSELFMRNCPSGIPVVEKTDAAGRPLVLKYRDGTRECGYQFWLRVGQKFGWDKLPGTRFSAQEKNGKIELRSTGAGHGVGYCQWGASGMALAGRSYKEILHHYFPGSVVLPK